MSVKAIVTIAVIAVTTASIPRPRGVSDSNASHYQPNSQNVFVCLDGSQTFPYSYINDDYCDCSDGSDEPGTSACPNAKFTCTNAGHRPLIMPSSRVNDGVCDCCDGTDEYEGFITCANNCKELGQKHKEEQERIMKLHEEGIKKKREFAEEGKKKKEEKKQRLEQLKAERETAETERQDFEAKKNEAEIPEKEAKDKHQKAWEEEKARKEGEKEAQNALKAFKDLDSNNDGFVDILEMVVHPEFDIDSNGVVSDEEAKEHLEESEQVDQEVFVSKVWPNIKTIYKSLVPEPAAPEGETQPPADSQGETAAPPGDVKSAPDSLPPPSLDPEEYEGDEEEEEEEDEEDDDMDDDMGDEYHDTEAVPTEPAPILTQPGGIPIPSAVHDQSPEKKQDALYEEALQKAMAAQEMFVGNETEEGTSEDKMPDYDEETSKLIAAADAARNSYNTADQKVQSIDREISSLQTYLGLDMGPEEEFSVLKDQCFEYTDREYTYKLCPYDRASQRSKNGGSETSLGTWGKWNGPENDKYSSQLYERGQNCWNGPDRSVTVHLKCGPENQLTNAYEPSRCEYAFDFVTPVSCSSNLPNIGSHDVHDEL